MNYRLTIAAAGAVVLASFAEFSLIKGAAWFVVSVGAVVVVALAGTLTRLAPIPAAAGATGLGALACIPLLAAPSLYLKAAGMVVIACCAASASRLRFFQSIACAVTYLAALLLYLNLLEAHRQSFLAIVPTANSLHHLITLANNGSAMAKASPPVPDITGVILLAAGSIGLAAITVDFIAVRLHRPAIAGLPILVVYMAPIATSASVTGLAGVVAFLLAATGYLALLSSDGRSRLRGWGRLITVWHHSGEDERLGGADVATLAATGRRIGLAAVSAALIAPLLLPTLNLHHLFSGGGNGTGPGGGPGVELPKAIDQMRGLLTKASPQPVLTYRSTGQNAGEYLPVYVLNFDQSANKWGIVPPRGGMGIGTGPLLQPTGLAAGTNVASTSTTISLGQVVRGFDSRLFFLPVPYWPTQLQISGSWHESADTFMIYSGDISPAGLSYQVNSEQVVPTRTAIDAKASVPAPIAKAYLGYKTPVTARLTRLADKITKDAPNPFLKAVALEQWFHSTNFTYALGSNLPDTPQGLLTFLTTSRQGFCQQFAFAMAVLARLLGIPSRIDVGYTSGTQRADGSWLVTTADAHAWPELYFQGLGWLRFEPTPGGVAGQATANSPSYVAALGPTGPKKGTTNPGGPTPISTGPTANSSLNAKARALGSQGGGPGSLGKAPSAGSAPVIAVLVVLGLLLLAATVPATARVVTRRRRWLTAADDSALADAAWLEICADLDDFGVACQASDSPRTVAKRVCSETEGDEVARQAIGRVATVVERARYAPAPGAAGSVRADVRTVRRSLARSSGRIARLRARLFPASTITPIHTQVRHVLGVLTGWMPSPRED